jgi:hypothetical protein
MTNQIRAYLQRVTGTEDVEFLVAETLRQARRRPQPPEYGKKGWLCQLAQEVAVHYPPIATPFACLIWRLILMDQFGIPVQDRDRLYQAVDGAEHFGIVKRLLAESRGEVDDDADYTGCFESLDALNTLQRFLEHRFDRVA